MQFNNYIKTKLPFFVALSFTFVLASCGSYQYVGYDNDGIYQERQVVYEEATNVETETPSSDAESNSYYKNYFNDKANQYSDIPDDERIIFTDIDSYEGEYSDESQEEDYQDGYAGWGQASNNITINYIDYGWGFNDPWLWNGAWGWRYGWNSYYGWNRWGWNAGYGSFGWGWNAGWGYNYWCPPGFNGYYYNNHALAYNSGRRGSNLAYGNRNSVSRRNTSTISRRNSTNSRNNNATRSTTRRNSNATRSTTRRNNNSTIRRNTTRTRSTNTRSNSNTTRSRSNNTRSSTRMSTTPRRSNNSSTVRSSGNTSSRSSGTSRSSSSGGSGRRR